MSEKNKRFELLERGAEIIHLKGYHNTGINEILTASAVPKGSFYFYFKNKEDFGLQLIDFYLTRFLQAADHHIATPGIPYLQRLRNFFDDFLVFFENKNYRGGCPIGNFALEMADLNEHFREKLNGAFAKMKEKILMFLEKAQEHNEVPANGETDMPVNEIADFILNSWEGALLRLKVGRNKTQMHLFYTIVFEHLLKRQTKTKN